MVPVVILPALSITVAPAIAKPSVPSVASTAPAPTPPAKSFLLVSTRALLLIFISKVTSKPLIFFRLRLESITSVPPIFRFVKSASNPVKLPVRVPPLRGRCPIWE